MIIKIINLISTFIGTILYHILPNRRKIAEYNLSIILPNLPDKEKKKLLNIAL